MSKPPLETQRPWKSAAVALTREEALTEDLRETKERLEAFESVPAIKPMVITPYSPTAGEAIALACLSDVHVGERVDPSDVPGTMSIYNPQICKKRVTQFFQRALYLTQVQRHLAKIDEFCLALLGDLITGYLHEDQRESNTLSPNQEVLEIIELVCGGLELLLSQGNFKRIRIPCVMGNHGRTTPKPRVKTAFKNSWEYLLYRLLAREWEKEKRVEFYIAEGHHLYLRIFDFLVRFHHGDGIQYNGGTGGIHIPLNKAIAQWNTIQTADLDVMGHWHQCMDTGKAIINGCFAPDTRVLTPCGAKRIADVEVGDKVISRDGSVQLVEAIRAIPATEVVLLRAKGLPNVVEVTPNHLIWAVKGESSNIDRFSNKSPRTQTTVLEERPQWIPAGFLSEGDWIHTPVPSGTAEPISEDLAWVYGLFAAEGHTIVAGGKSKRHFRIEFTMHIEEEPVLARAKAILDAHLGQAGRTWLRPDRTTSQLSYSGEEVARLFRELFGHTAHHKKLPDWMYGMSKRLRQSVVQGWFDGDGHRGKQSNGTTVSEQLGWAIYQLALGTDIEPLFYVQTKRDTGTKGACRIWRLSFVKGQDVRWINGERFIRVDLRRRKIVKDLVVHDLQVSGEHTFCAEGFGVHNSVIGFGAYSLIIKAAYEPPRQAYAIIDRKRGKTLFAHIFTDYLPSGGAK